MRVARTDPDLGAVGQFGELAMSTARRLDSSPTLAVSYEFAVPPSSAGDLADDLAATADDPSKLGDLATGIQSCARQSASESQDNLSFHPSFFRRPQFLIRIF